MTVVYINAITSGMLPRGPWGADILSYEERGDLARILDEIIPTFPPPPHSHTVFLQYGLSSLPSEKNNCGMGRGEHQHNLHRSRHPYLKCFGNTWSILKTAQWREHWYHFIRTRRVYKLTSWLLCGQAVLEVELRTRALALRKAFLGPSPYLLVRPRSKGFVERKRPQMEA